MGFQLHTREIDHVVIVEAVGKLTLTDGHTKLRDLIHVFLAAEPRDSSSIWHGLNLSTVTA